MQRGEIVNKKLVILLLLAISLFGCTSIPQNGSILNQKVSEGITRYQIEVEKIIKALADVERAILNEEWDTIFAKVEKAYMVKHNITSESTLTQIQRRAIAANAAQTYNNLINDIAIIEQTLVSQTQANSKTLIAVNDEVTKYLLSVEELDSARSNITKKIAGIVGIDLTSISGQAEKLIGGI